MIKNQIKKKIRDFYARFSPVNFGIIFLAMLILLTNSYNSTISAYFTHTYKWNIDPVIYHSDSGYNEVGAATNSWYFGDAPQLSSGDFEDCDIWIYKESVAESWDGLTISWYTGTVLYEADTCLNSNYCDGYSSYARRSVICHEFGHALGMADNYLIEQYIAIMNPYTFGGGGYSRYGYYGIYSPQTDDANGIEYLYG